MTKDDAIREACSIVGLANNFVNSAGSHASDCFCPGSPGNVRALLMGFESDYRNEGFALAFVRKAVEEKIKRDGPIDIEAVIIEEPNRLEAQS